MTDYNPIHFVEDLFSTASSKVADAATVVVNAAGQLEKKWTDAVASLKAAGNEFTNNYNTLIAMQSRIDPNTKVGASYKDLMSRGATLKATISNMLTGINSVYQKARSAVGMNGMGELGDFGISLGVGLTVAAITGATLLLVKWNNDAKALITQQKIIDASNEQLKVEVDAAKAAGASPAQIQAIVTKRVDATNAAVASAGKGLADNIQDTLQSAGKFLILGAIIYYGAPLVMGMINKGKSK